METSAAVQLHEEGIALLRDLIPLPTLAVFHAAGKRCFQEIATAPAHYHFNPYSHSVLVTALADFGLDLDQILALIATPGLPELFSQALPGNWTCNLQQSWLRKKFAPSDAPAAGYQPHTWHQDGALGVRFPLEPGPSLPITQLVTCWIPLNTCGNDSPGLEFVRSRQSHLLHFTELGDHSLRSRFEPQEFWAPELNPGDALVFLNTTLHRTHTHPGMRQNRLSVEYRLFPGD